MKIILGIGNPGKEYEETRHNTGFLVIDNILKKTKKENLKFKNKFNAEYLKTNINDKEIIFIKPKTYVNNSGESLIQYVNYFKINPADVIIIYDDIDTKPGEIRIRKAGSSGGHNGIKSILNYTKDFIRVRVGIGREDFKGDRINHVLSKPNGKELEEWTDGIDKAADAVLDILKIGVDKSMNKHNKKNKQNKIGKEKI